MSSCFGWYLTHPLCMFLCEQRNSTGSENPSDVFRFLVEERTQCCQSRRVRYTQRVDYCIQLPAPIEAATNRGKEDPVRTHVHINCGAALRSHSCLRSEQLAWCWAQVAPAAGRTSRSSSERAQKVLTIKQWLLITVITHFWLDVTIIC